MSSENKTAAEGVSPGNNRRMWWVVILISAALLLNNAEGIGKWPGLQSVQQEEADHSHD